MSRWTPRDAADPASLYVAHGITRRPDPVCTCSDVVGLAAFLERGCELHGDAEGVRRHIEMIAGRPPRARHGAPAATRSGDREEGEAA